MNVFLFVLSWAIVAFGQPVWSISLGLLGAIGGYALFWKILLDIPEKKDRFLIAGSWFTLVQLVQLSWFVGHPYFYIYVVWLFFALALGVQFGIVSLLITRKNLEGIAPLFAIAGAWTLMEWSRLYFMTGFTWNPIGLALNGSLYARQIASIGGIYFVSYWVILTNLALLKVWITPATPWKWGTVVVLASLPYLYGAAQIKTFQQREIDAPTLNAALVQTAFPCEEAMDFKSGSEMIRYVQQEWQQIASWLSEIQGEKIDLIVLPEYVVPYGTFYAVFPQDEVYHFLKTNYPLKVDKIPEKEPHLAMQVGPRWMVNNAYWGQSLANLFNADLITGLEDHEFHEDGTKNYYSAAYLFQPHQKRMQRYEKRVLLPLGEYIPFDFCRKWAAAYGVGGSFSFGDKATVFQGKAAYAPSICYEETFGCYMRDSRLNGAALLVNMTNDGWYLDSRLPQYHLELARLRTVELGVPLVRACNTGVTCALNPFGEQIATLGQTYREQEFTSGVLLAHVPLFTFPTLYLIWGNAFAVAISLLSLIPFIPKF